MLILKAEHILPITTPSFMNGGVVVDEGKIIDFGKIEDILKIYKKARIKDFGKAVIMPGFVNVHSHVEYTDFEGLIKYKQFFDWISDLIALKTILTKDDFISSAELGILRMIRAGITTVADPTNSGAAFDAAKKFGVRAIIYQELFGPDDRLNQNVIYELKLKVDKMLEESRGTNISIGISPHSVYTISPSLFKKALYFAEENDLPISIHTAESLDECELVKNGTGSIALLYRQRGIEWTKKDKTVIKYLECMGLFESKVMVQMIHLTNASRDDLEIIANKGISAALCPCSNANLGVGISPISGIIEYGILAGLGTDSSASNCDISMFDEMKVGFYLSKLDRRYTSDIRSFKMLELATISGAKSLNLDHIIGSIDKGKAADLIAVSLDDREYHQNYDIFDDLVFRSNNSKIMMTMIDGKILYENGKYNNIDVQEIIEKNTKVSEKLRRNKFKNVMNSGDN
jgi:cytosine/adenosine deaminase-related metal-dependent hydrolase